MYENKTYAVKMHLNVDIYQRTDRSPHLPLDQHQWDCGHRHATRLWIPLEFSENMGNRGCNIEEIKL